MTACSPSADRVLLHINQKDLGQRNAETVHVVELARALSKAGWAVRVLSPRVGRYEGEVPFEISYLPALKRPRLLRLLSYEVSLLGYLLLRLRLLRRARVYVRKGLFLVAPLLLARAVGAPRVLEVNAADSELARLLDLPRYIAAPMAWISSWCYRLADEIVVVSEAIRRGLIEEGVPAGKIHVVPNGANTELFHPRDVLSCRQALGLDPGCRYLCFVGQMLDWHGLEVLLEAMPQVAARFDEVRVLLVGDGPARRRLEARTAAMGLSERIIFTGAVPFAQVPLYLGAAVVCVSPLLKRTGSPVKLFEYLACGCPVVISDVPGASEIMAECDCGWLVEPGSAQDLAAKLIAALGAPAEELAAKGRRGREAVVQRHSWDHAARQIMPLLGRP